MIASATVGAATERPRGVAHARRHRALRPADWPGPGPIDLAVHDLPHASSTLEWWYVNAHLATASGRDVSLFASFFRTAVGRNEDAGNHIYAHALTWALVD